MRNRPRIGVTTYPRNGTERATFSLPSAYVDAVRTAGGLPLLLTPGEEEPGEFLDHVDGVIFTGGGDLAPKLFEAPLHPTHYGVDEERDAFELALLEAALERSTPTLGICRGMQLLNVLLGGDLHTHLPEVLGDAVPHRSSGRCAARHHVRLDPNSRLAAVFKETDLWVRSWHHQAVNRLGRGLVPTAWAPDGTVEALELAGAPCLLAVQWHPELEQEEASPQRRLFQALIDLVRA